MCKSDARDIKNTRTESGKELEIKNNQEYGVRERYKEGRRRSAKIGTNT
jgi:hypothetical protein